jgi:hypothetical protein
MKNILVTTLLGLGLATASATVLAGEWKIMPVLDAAYKPEITVALAGGVMNGTPAGSGNYSGAELAFNCLALHPPTGIIRSKVSYGQFDHNGLKLKTFEVNPRWTTRVAPDVTVGFGPGIGFVQADVAGKTTSMTAMQLGADLNYRIGQLNLGLDARWQNTANKDIAPGIRGANNTLIMAKVGISF